MWCGCFRNPSSGSGLSESGGGSLERAKLAAERRKKEENTISAINSGLTGKESRVEVTRVNPGDLIAELLQGTNLEQDEMAESKFLNMKVLSNLMPLILKFTLIQLSIFKYFFLKSLCTKFCLINKASKVQISHV